MDISAVNQANGRLRKARRALEELQLAQNFETAEAAWTDFLISAATFYSKLEQGAKSHARSQAWFREKKKERRDDPLLRYLHRARNSNEHGIELVVAGGGNKTGFGNRRLKFGEREAGILEALDDNGDPIPGSKSRAYLYGPSIQLVRVHDRRFGDYCDPPTAHRGKTIDVDDNYPYGIGMLALLYLQSMLSEAEELVPKDSVK